MKRINLLLVLTMLISFASFSEEIPTILKSTIKYKGEVELVKVYNQIHLRCGFGSDEILNPEDLKKIEGLVVTKVQLLFTSYKLADAFDQVELNEKRLKQLKKLSRELFENELIEWELVAQTDAESPIEGISTFHGFVITYRPPDSEEFLEVELEYIEEVIHGPRPCREIEKPSEIVKFVEKMPQFPGGTDSMHAFIQNNIKYPRKAKGWEIQGTVMVSFVVGVDGALTRVRPYQGIGGGCDEEAVRVVKMMPNWIPAISAGREVKTLYVLPVEFVLDESAPKKKAVKYPLAPLGSPIACEPLPIDSECIPRLMDSSVLKILDRNEHWRNQIVVCDFTGSMSPYTSQLLVWHQLNVKNKKQKTSAFVFFNDGDRKADAMKVVGNTGGIYIDKGKSFNAVKQLAIETMRGGGGGDRPENNIEAVLEGINQCDDYDGIVLIADNYATPRDLELIEHINQPIKIILCGTRGGINTNYLDLAFATGGSLHTMEEDITDLTIANEKKAIKIGGKKYRVVDGKFKLVR